MLFFDLLLLVALHRVGVENNDFTLLTWHSSSNHRLYIRCEQITVCYHITCVYIRQSFQSLHKQQLLNASVDDQE